MIPAGLRPSTELRWPDQRDDAPAWKQESMLTGYVVLRNKAGGSSPETGLAVADAEFTGIGRDDDPRRFKTSVKVYDPVSRKLIIGKERNVRLPFQTCVRVRRMALHGSVKGMD
jgi:hypothetical protein